MNEKELKILTLRYEKLLGEVSSKDFYKVDLDNRINTYTCVRKSCGNVIITKDVDAGVTPFIIGCPKCGERAQSSFYKAALGSTPTHEWYRPSLDELKGNAHGPGAIEHILRGGLLLRQIQNK